MLQGEHVRFGCSEASQLARLNSPLLSSGLWIVNIGGIKREQDYKIPHRTVTPAPLNGNYFQFSPDSASTGAKTLFRGCPSPRSAVRLGRSALGVLQVGDMMVHCAGCERPILDRFLLNVLDRAWHAKCVQCCECNCNLTEKCFSRDGKLYCKMDFFR